MLKAIIIDDEEGARISLKKLLEVYVNDVEVIAETSNVPDGVIKINQLNPDVVFLDIEMPEYNGFELFDFFKEINFHVIFITAYSQYAIKAFEVSAIDYLLKPVDVELLIKSIQKLKSKIEQKNFIERLEIFKDSYFEKDIKKIAIPSKEGLNFINIDEILFFEAERAYSTIYLKNNTRFTISKPLKIYEDVLINQPFFFRPHRSYLINLKHIKIYNKSSSLITMENGSLIAVSRDKKQSFENKLKELKILA